MVNKIHNLDEGVQEHFDFIIKGHTYRFRQPNGEEIERFRALSQKKDEKKATEFLYSFIDQVDPKSPPFKEIGKKMIAPQWRRFREMIEREIGA